ncbi:MAG: hypothetical protein ACUVSJ_03090 [Anaerolineae bacterium]
MSGQTKTVMGVVSFVGGEWTGESPQVLAVSEPATFREVAKGDLFILVDLPRTDASFPVAAQGCQALATTIRDTYYRSSGGVIASLRRALLTAERTQPFSNMLVGMIALVVRDEEIFLASVGRMAAFLVHGDEVQRFPERVTNALPLDEQPGTLFFHTAVHPGDMLVLADSRFSALVTVRDVAAAVVRQEVEDAIAALGDLVIGEDCTAMLVAIEPAEGAPIRVVSHTVISRIRSFSPYLERIVNAAVRGMLSTLILIGRASRALLIQMLPERATPPSPPCISKEDEATRITKATLHISVGQTDAASTMPGESSIQREAITLGRTQRAWRLIAILLPLCVIALAVFTYWREGVSEENTFQMLMEQTRTVYQQAVNADEPTARRLLDKAVELLQEAALLRPEDTTHNTLYTQVLQYRDRIDRVQRLPSLTLLRRYDSASTVLRRVISDGLDVYVLDSGDDVVYRHRLDEAVEVLMPDETEAIVLRRAQQVSGNVVGELVDMTWAAAGVNRQVGALLVLETGGLLEYLDPRGVTSLAIGGRERWKLPVAVMGYAGNVYILDPQAGQIFRYRPGEGGYPGAPEHYFPQDARELLSDAVDMAIDGYVYVLHSTGSVRKFEGGKPVAFDLIGLDRPLSSPTAIFTAPDQQVHYLYIADAGNRRIVQLEKDGRFVRQFKPPIEEGLDFADLRSLFVDEVAGKLYLLDGQALYLASLPPVPW